MKPTYALRSLLLGSALATSPVLHATPYYWNTTTTGSWATGANWSDNATSGGASATGCASNMRQCVALSLMFASEQNGRLPRLYLTNGQTTGAIDKPYLPVEQRTVSNAGTNWWPDLISTYAESGSIFSCLKLKMNATNANTAGKPSNVAPLGIGINIPFMAESDTTSTPLKWVLLSPVPDQGRVVWFADAASGKAGEPSGAWKDRVDEPGTGSCLFRGASTTGTCVMPRHGGKINVGFADGHVSLVNPTEINWGSTDTDQKHIGFTKFQ